MNRVKDVFSRGLNSAASSSATERAAGSKSLLFKRQKSSLKRRLRASSKKAKVYKPQFYQVEDKSGAEVEIEAYDGEQHTQTNENVEYLRALVMNRDRKRIANRKEEERKRKAEAEAQAALDEQQAL